MDVAAIDRFSGPVLAERSWISEQARACVVRPGNEDLETLVQRDVRGKGAGELVWDSWRRGDGRWTVVAALGDDAPISTWIYDPRSRSVQPEDAASHRLASEDVVVPLRPTSSTVTLPRDAAPDAVIADDALPAESDSDETAVADATESEATPAVEPEVEPAPAEPARGKSRKSRRASVPRWDEILFGAGQNET